MITSGPFLSFSALDSSHRADIGQTIKIERRVPVLTDKGVGLCVKILGVTGKDPRGLHRQRAVNVDRHRRNDHHQ